MMNTMKNKYIIRSKISEAKTREIIKLFCLDIEASKIAKLSNISRQSINKIIKQIRILIAKECEKVSTLNGKIEVDESYFGAKRVRGKRGRGAGKKTSVFLLRYACNASSRAKAHYRVKHSKNEFALGKNHINGIENFWGYAKHRLAKFKGIKKENFLLHLKETEFR